MPQMPGPSPTKSPRKIGRAAVEGRVNSWLASLPALNHPYSNPRSEPLRRALKNEPIYPCSVPTPKCTINSLPTNILRTIFRYALPTPQEMVLSPHPLSLRNEVAPMLLCHVCERWKDVAENYPMLWTNLRFFIEDFSCDDEEDWERPTLYRPFRPSGVQLDLPISTAVQKWKRYARDSPLQLSVIILHDGILSSRGVANAQPPILGHLDTTVFRNLTKLTLCRVRTLDLLKLPMTSFPLLEDLIITTLDHSLVPPNRRRGPISIRCFGKNACPRLTRVAIGDTLREANSPPPAILLPFKQLSVLFLLSATWSDGFEPNTLFMPRLKFLYLTVDVPEQEESPLWRPCIWPNLSDLTIKFQSSPFGPFPFDEVRSLPVPHPIFLAGPMNITSLRIISDGRVCFTPELLYWLGDLPYLQNLSLCFTDTHVTLYIFIFTKTPYLKTLDIQLGSGWAHYDTLFRSLIACPNLLPDLEVLTLELDPGWEDTSGLMCAFRMGLFAFVFDRMRDPRRCLRRVVIRLSDFWKGHCDLDGDVVGGERGDGAMSTLPFSELEQFREEGLDLKIEVLPRDGMRLDFGDRWIDRDERLDWPEVRDAFLDASQVEGTWCSDDESRSSDGEGNASQEGTSAQEEDEEGSASEDCPTCQRGRVAGILCIKCAIQSNGFL